MKTRKALVESLRLRYRRPSFSDRVKILDEFMALPCHHCKHAIRVLRGEFNPATDARLRDRVYGDEVRRKRIAAESKACWRNTLEIARTRPSPERSGRRVRSRGRLFMADLAHREQADRRVPVLLATGGADGRARHHGRRCA